MIRLDKYLSHAKVGSRKEVKKIIRNGWVKVNDVECRNDDTKVNEDCDVITINDEVINYQTYYYLMLNKPSGYLCSNTDGDYPSILNIINEVYAYDLNSVGRLDVDTTGLLILTNDGKLTHHLISPTHHVDKVYLVDLTKDIDKQMIEQLEKEITYDGLTYKPGKVKVINAKQIYLTINEGKFHQVKNMLECVGNKVVKLKRIKMGDLKLDENLKEGEYRSLSELELKILKES